MINQEVEANAKKESGTSRNRSNLNEVMENIDLSWVAKSDRFKHFTRQKQVLTINRKTEYEIEDFRK